MDNETTCKGADCPMACRWRNYTPTWGYDLPPSKKGYTWGERGQDGYWHCERYVPDLRPREAKEQKA